MSNAIVALREQDQYGSPFCAGLLFDGMLIAAGGFGFAGIPEIVIRAIRDAGTTERTIASNDWGVDGFGLGMLLKQSKKMISSCR
ncbi:CoA-transferase [Mesorhizobium caraganae]|uniref:CoA-transferase n=1 Tax=Mesorhizobium caraganae TaxID=483206 RepID=UPI003DA0E556